MDHYTNSSRSAFTSTGYAYDTRGNRISAKDSAGNTWSWNYDARGRQTKAVDPDTGTATTTWTSPSRRPPQTTVRTL
ncbi:RHS repeat domain-containing protein [Streptomyces sp. NPDC005195]|uniref:RHS repeat domain-containing protein n=1 Tax=Streptomyces sp. NPDC005195 TaxID=3154561 RepID=UPI0033BC97B6